MPPRPFPFPNINIGTDICHTRRIHDLLLSPGQKNPRFDRTKHLNRFLGKFLTWLEQQEFWNFAEGRVTNVFRGGVSRPAHLDARAVRWLSGRWAAKEAVIKAVQYRQIGFMHIQILKSRAEQTGSGPLYALILDRPASAFETANPTFRRVEVPNSAISDSPRRDNRDVMSESTHSDSATTAENWFEQAAGEPGDDAEGVAAADASLSYGGQVFTPGELQNDDLDGQVARVSISHDGEYATAVCLAVQLPREGDVGGEAAAREP